MNDEPRPSAWLTAFLFAVLTIAVFLISLAVSRELTELKGQAVQRGHAEWRPGATGAPEFKWIDRK